MLNAVVLWNTKYTDAIITELRENGEEILEDDVARLSPLADAHINMLGRYAFTALTLQGLRPFRGPTAPGFDKALQSLQEGDTLVITTLDRLGRSTANMLDLAKDFRERGIGLRVLNLGGGDVDTGTPMGSMVFTVMAALAQMELEIKRERITDSVSKRRPASHPGGSGPGHVPSHPATGVLQGSKHNTGSLPRADTCRGPQI